MFSKIQVFQGENPDVWKYVFEKDDICVEAVLYRYESFQKRTVLCISVQSGCPVGCVFCGTGKKFIRNLTADEIQYQVDHVINWVSSQIDWPLNSVCEKFQIMFMSMGEPMLNWSEVDKAIRRLNDTYRNAQLLISTIGVKDYSAFFKLCDLSREIGKVGLQFSLHSGDDEERDEIIPFKNKMSIREIRDAGIMWNSYTHRPVYLNICVDEFNLSPEERERIKDLFPPSIFSLTFSVICEYENGQVVNQTLKDKIDRKMQNIMANFLCHSYNVRKFDPAGQDDIGAGCGQLWYTQSWMKEHFKGK
jgi:23S rRNA (adenine2503-C2)-methyltransferase